MKQLGKLFGWLILLAFWALIWVQSCATVDLRPASVRKSYTPGYGKALLDSMYLAHGGPEWAQVNTYEVDFEDEFFGFIGQNSHPYKTANIAMTLQYAPRSFDGRAVFTSEEMKGTIWGIQSWQTYHQRAGENPRFRQDRNVFFWLPTYQYFIELPLRIREADIISYAGQQEVEGKSCKVVFVSWNQAAPQRSTDQYLLYIDADTYRLIKVQYTVREMYNFLEGTAWYKDYQSYQGVLLPARMPVESNLVREGLLHEMRILDFRPNAIEAEVLRPAPDLSSSGTAKPES